MVRLPPTLLLPVVLLVPDVVALAVLCVLDALLFVAADMAIGTGAALHAIDLRFPVLQTTGFALGQLA